MTRKTFSTTSVLLTVLLFVLLGFMVSVPSMAAETSPTPEESSQSDEKNKESQTEEDMVKVEVSSGFFYIQEDMTEELDAERLDEFFEGELLRKEGSHKDSFNLPRILAVSVSDEEIKSEMGRWDEDDSAAMKSAVKDKSGDYLQETTYVVAQLDDGSFKGFKYDGAMESFDSVDGASNINSALESVVSTYVEKTNESFWFWALGFFGLIILAGLILILAKMMEDMEDRGI